MAIDIAAGLGFLGVLIMAASVVGTVERREKFAFVLGVALVLVGLIAVAGTAGGVVSLVGLALMVASTVPLLLQ